MTDAIQKGISSISDLLYDHLGFSVTDVGNNGDRLGRFIKYFALLRFKHDEQLLAKAEIEKSKAMLNQLSLSQAKKYNELIVLSFLHNIGYDVSFSFIHAVNMAQQGDPMSKRLGYLLCSLFFDENHQFALLLINTILKDLQNKNVANECTALVATSQLVATGDLPTILPYIRKHLSHRVPIARKKVLQCLYTCVAKESSLMLQAESHLLNCLKDSDPGVVWAAVEIYLLVVKKDPSSYRYLVTPVRNMMEKVVDGKLPEVYSYHNYSSPWFLMSLVRFLVLLSKGCQKSTDETSTVLVKLLKQTKTSHKIGFAILFEAVRAVSRLDSVSEELMEISSQCVHRFLSAQSFYLKLSGIRLLAMLIPKRMSTALGFQSAILDVLRCSDPSLRHAALELLFVMANKSNKGFVCQKILEEMERMEEEWSCDLRVISDLHRRLLDLVYRFSKDDPVWFVTILFEVIERADRAGVQLNFDHRILLDSLENCPIPGKEEQMLLAREKAVELSVEKLERIHKHLIKGEESTEIGFISLQVLVRFLASSKFDSNDVVKTLVSLMPNIVNSRFRQDIPLTVMALLDVVTPDTRAWIGKSLEALLESDSRAIDAMDKLNLIELQILSSREPINPALGPSLEKVETDGMLDIMDSYVVEYLERGGKPYSRPELYKVPRLVSSQLMGGKGNNWILDRDEGQKWNPGSKSEAVNSDRGDLKFSNNASDAVWSRTGYNHATQSEKDTNVDENPRISKELSSLSEQLFSGF